MYFTPSNRVVCIGRILFAPRGLWNPLEGFLGIRHGSLELAWYCQIGTTVGVLHYDAKCGLTLDDQTPDDDLDAFSVIRAIMAITGGVLFLSLILFLRNTFLPFSNFVTGTVHVSTVHYVDYGKHSSFWVIKLSPFFGCWAVSFR
jgi:hypothetical protein